MWRGGKDSRLFSFCVAGGFFVDRILLATVSNAELFNALIGVVDFIAFLCVMLIIRTRTARVIAFLFAAKIGMYIALQLGGIEFQTMAAWSELAGYMQLAIIGMGAFHGGARKQSTNNSSSVFRGNALLHLFSKRRG